MADTIPDAQETVRFAIFDALIGEMPVGSHPYLEQAAKVAAKAIQHSHFKWALKVLGE